MRVYRAWKTFPPTLLLQPVFHNLPFTWQHREAKADQCPTSQGWIGPFVGPKDQHGLYGQKELRLVLADLHKQIIYQDLKALFVPGTITVWGRVEHHDDGQIRAEFARIEELYVMICSENACEKCSLWLDHMKQLSLNYQVPLVAGKVSIVTHRPLLLAEVSQQQ